ncbi:MAG: hypothetical protein JRM99_06025, partial [Nitrososphaerota archaeon]|nr:hypothetical protein [Nitrososphaerota archaeon]
MILPVVNALVEPVPLLLNVTVPKVAAVVGYAVSELYECERDGADAVTLAVVLAPPNMPNTY